MRADEQAVSDGLPAFAFDDGLEDCGESEGDGTEEYREWDWRAEGVEEEGYGAVFDAEWYET